MNISITEDINGQKYVRAEQEPKGKGLHISQRFKDWQFIQGNNTCADCIYNGTDACIRDTANTMDEMPCDMFTEKEGEV